MANGSGKIVLTISIITCFFAAASTLITYNLATAKKETTKKEVREEPDRSVYATLFQQEAKIATLEAELKKEGTRRQRIRHEFREAESFLAANCSSKFKSKVPVIAALVNVASEQYDINPALVARILVLESRCNSKAVNPDSGAMGLMQIHPVHDPSMLSSDLENLLKGVSILHYCLSKYTMLEKALECYGAGEKDINVKDRWTYPGVAIAGEFDRPVWLGFISIHTL